MNVIKLINLKKEFLILVFANLITQLGITYYIFERTNNNKINKWILFFIQLLIIFAIILIPMPTIVKFILFCIFSYTFGLMLSSLKNVASSNMIQIAIQGSLLVFCFMFVTGLALLSLNINLGYRFGAILFWLLFLLILGKLILILGKGLSRFYKILSFFGIILFAVYIVYDTNKILQRNYNGDFITASLDYYLDILNLFTNILGFQNN